MQEQLLKFLSVLLLLFILVSCSSSRIIEKEIESTFKEFAKKSNFNPVDSFLDSLLTLPVRQREDSLILYMTRGQMPSYNFHFKKVSYHYENTLGKRIEISFWVSPDYLSIGSNEQFIRIPLTPQSAQLLADKFHAILPTTKIVDEIYKTADVKLPPIPLTKNRDSLSTFIKHNKLIEAQLSYNIPNGIVAGIKKDVVQSNAILKNPKPNRVAIYGWHKLNGKPIQPLYTGHVDWYVDYSHGIRLVYEKMLIDNKIFLVKDVLNNPEFSSSICRDSVCKLMRYN